MLPNIAERTGMADGNGNKFPQNNQYGLVLNNVNTVLIFQHTDGSVKRGHNVTFNNMGACILLIFANFHAKHRREYMKTLNTCF